MWWILLIKKNITNKKEDSDINNNQENIVNNISIENNENNENINNISNNSKIFQSLKMNENKLKIFSSKIKINDEQKEGNISNQEQLNSN